MVEGVKPIALEFTLTRATCLKMLACDPAEPPLEGGHDELRFRVVICSGALCYYKERNVLGEDVWTMIGEDHGPRMGGDRRWLVFTHSAVLTLALGHLTEYLHGKAPAQERANGALVFDLGTV